MPLLVLGIVSNESKVVESFPVSIRVASLEAEVVCLGLQNQQEPNISCNFRGLKVWWVSNGELLLHGTISGISVRCILAMSDEETESYFGGVSEGTGVGCLEGG